MEILTPPQKKFLKVFFSSSLKDKFFLSGGTALAGFYFYHRMSEDLDLFSVDRSLDFVFVSAEINKIIDKHFKVKTKPKVSSADFLRYILEDKRQFLKIDLVKDVPVHFGALKNIEGIVVDSLENIAVGKLLAIFGRTDAKDFIDFYFLSKSKKVVFEDIFRQAQKKDLGLNELYFANMLAEVENLKYFPKTIKPFDKKDLVNFYLALSRKLFLKIKPKR